MGHGHPRAGYLHSTQIWTAQRNCRRPVKVAFPSQDTDGEEGLGKVMATLTVEPISELKALQRQDPELLAIIQFLESGLLQDDEKTACALLSLTQSQYIIQEGILYCVLEDSTLQLIPSASRRKQLFRDAHGGAFGAHLGDWKIHSQLKKHYWWPGMRSEIAQWTGACMLCATRGVGRSPKPPLTPIPVAGPFDRIGVDVIQFPKSNSGNRYVVVFVDYMTKWPPEAERGTDEDV